MPGTLDLAGALKVNKSLKKLYLGTFHALMYVISGKNKIGLDGLKALMEAIRGNSTLIVLEIGTTNLANHLIRKLQDRERGLPLHLGCTEEQLHAEVAVSELVFGGENVDGNSIGDVGVRDIADALAVNISLMGLSLGRLGGDIPIDENLIGDEGAKSLAQALRSNNALSVLSLGTVCVATERVDYNKIGEQGGKELYESLSANKSITTLDLGMQAKIQRVAKNEVPDRTVMDIKAVTFRNKKTKQREEMDVLKTIQYTPNLLSQISPPKA